MANKIVAIAEIKNVADIIESSMRHMFRIANEIFIHDLNSSDNTMEIVNSLKNEKLPIRIFNDSMNSMIQTAINESAQIIIPFDADEFLIATNGQNSDILRNFLQDSDISKIYSATKTKCRFLDTNEEANIYALNRNILRSNIKSQSIIIGVDAWKNNQLSLSADHSQVFLPTGEVFQAITSVYGLESIYFPYRSKEQKNFQQIILQVEAIQSNTTYDKMPVEQTDEFTEPSSAEQDLLPYKKECKLLYTKSIDSMKNLLQLSKNLAHQIKLTEIINQKKLVRIFIFHQGDADKTINSIDSALNQTYPYKKIYIVTLKTDNAEKIFEVEKKSLSELKFIDPQTFSKLLKENDGDFVQFITAGDKLKQEKLSHMIEMFESNNKFDVYFSESTQPTKDFVGSYMTMMYPKQSEMNFEIASINGSELFFQFLENGYIIPAGITRIFFKQDFFNDAIWIDNWILRKNVEASQYVLWNAILNYKIGFVNEILVESDAENWNIEALNIFLNIWNLCIEQLHNQKALSDEKYNSARKNFELILSKARS